MRRWGVAQLVTRLRHAIATAPLATVLACAGLLIASYLSWFTVRSLTYPIYGVHEWRQGWTYSVSYGFLYESWDFFHPHHNHRGSDSGIVGMEPPIYPYVVAILVRVFGDHPTLARLLTFGFVATALGVWSRKLAKLDGAGLAIAALVFGATSSSLLSEARQVQPDPVALALALMASSVFWEHARSGRPRTYGAAMLLYCGSILTKPFTLACLPAMFLFSVWGPHRVGFRGASLRLLPFALPVALYLAWQAWANHLVDTYMGGTGLIAINQPLEWILRDATSSASLEIVFVRLVPNWATHCLFFPFVITGLVLSFRKPLRSMGVPFFAWAVGACAVGAGFSSRFPSNWYYMLVFLPPLLFYGAVGLRSWGRVVCGRTSDRLEWAFAVATTAAAVANRLLLPDVPWEALEHRFETLAVHQRQWFTAAPEYWQVLGGAAVLGVVASLAGVGAGPVRRRVLGLLLGCALLTSSVIAIRDVRQTVRFYSGEEHHVAGYVQQQEIRAAVDTHSEREDLLLACHSNPGLLYRAGRNGLAHASSQSHSHGVAYYRQMGFQLYLHIDAGCDPVPAAFRNLPLLDTGDDWQLYCLAEDACDSER